MSFTILGRLFYRYGLVTFLGVCLALIPLNSIGQNQSIARSWNEILLHAIRTDFARPTVHARNLYHLSVAHYDCFTAYSPKSSTYLLGNEIDGFSSNFEGVVEPEFIDSARHESICYASYRLLNHRFQNSPGYTSVLFKMDSLMAANNYSTSDTSANYLIDGPSALGNYIAEQIILYGIQDGSNELNDYDNIYYQATNDPILVEQPGNPSIEDPNRWQAISLTTSIDQSGNQVASTPPHLSPEWGNVDPFALNDSLISVYSRNGDSYQVYLDPGEPAYIDTTDTLELSSLYKWNHCMVSVWQSHLDPSNGTMIDISPASRGNLSTYPQTKEDHPSFYDYFNGGVQQSTGHAMNPVTGTPYSPQIVPLGDYARVLAEFWADGIDSETPPGHWFEILHGVIDSPLFIRQWMGQGDTLSILEYDIRAHFVLGGAMHDAAVAAWSVKGWYDYIRPVSAIRLMAQLGQSSDTNLVNFHPGGIPLIPNYIELVDANDPLQGSNQEHVGKIKLYTWKGPDYINDPETDIAGVGWILAENWWPYQRPTFVTPPFAGYVSGHSTFSRTAANVLTFMTGSPYFPGGIGEFYAQQGEFLKFEDGPSVDITLQWATYQDAADECSLSRIWGGIHPPIDDVPGRLMGDQIGTITFDHGNNYISSVQPEITELAVTDSTVNISDIGNIFSIVVTYDTTMNTTISPTVQFLVNNPTNDILSQISSTWLNDSIFEFNFEILIDTVFHPSILIQVDSALSASGKYQNPHIFAKKFFIDTERPSIDLTICSDSIINDETLNDPFYLTITVSEACDTNSIPQLSFLNSIANDALTPSSNSYWINESSYLFAFNIIDNDVVLDSVLIEISQLTDIAGNLSIADTFLLDTRIDTREPNLVSYTINDTLLNFSDLGINALVVNLTFDKRMNTYTLPTLGFYGDSIISTPLNYGVQSEWVTDSSCIIYYHFNSYPVTSLNTNILLSDLKDFSGNSPSPDTINNAIILDNESPLIDNIIPLTSIVYDGNTGNDNFYVDILFSEKMNINQQLLVEVRKNDIPTPSFGYNPFSSAWLNDTLYRAFFNVSDDHIEIDSLSLLIRFAEDAQFNQQLADTLPNVFELDTKNPSTNVFNANSYDITNFSDNLALIMIFDEAMDDTEDVTVTFSDSNASLAFTEDPVSSQWYNDLTYEMILNINNTELSLQNVQVILENAKDKAGNNVVIDTLSSPLNIDLTYLGFAINAIQDIKVYPNPLSVSEQLTIQIPSISKKATLQIKDLLGRKVENISINTHKNEGEITIINLSSGTYILTIEVDNIIHTKKIIVK